MTGPRDVRILFSFGTTIHESEAMHVENVLPVKMTCVCVTQNGKAHGEDKNPCYPYLTSELTLRSGFATADQTPPP